MCFFGNHCGSGNNIKNVKNYRVSERTVKEPHFCNVDNKIITIQLRLERIFENVQEFKKI